MSEKLQHQHGENHETVGRGVHERKEQTNETSSESKSELKALPEKQPANIEDIKNKIEREAKNVNEISLDNAAEKNDSSRGNYLASQELKTETLRRTIKNIQKKLSRPNKTLSKIVHQPVVSSLSKAGEKTIARPTGLVTGSLLALVGSSYLLYSAKHYGYKYNFSVVIVLFGGGYLVGLFVELIFYVFRRLKNRH